MSQHQIVGMALALVGLTDIAMGFLVPQLRANRIVQLGCVAGGVLCIALGTAFYSGML